GLVRVRLVGVRGLARAQEVDFGITGEAGDRVDLTLDQQRKTALARAEAELVGVSGLIVQVGYLGERGTDVRDHIVIAPHAFQREVAAGRNGQALVTKLAWRTELDRRAFGGWERPPRHDALHLRLSLLFRMLLLVEALLQSHQTSLELANFL